MRETGFNKAKHMKFIFRYFTLLGLLVTAGSCDKKDSRTGKEQNESSNPFFAASTLSFQAPAFDKIKDTDFRPALLEGIRQQEEEVRKIAENPEQPTFENTLAALEKRGQMYSRVSNVFYLFTGANTNDSLDALNEEIAPKESALEDAVFLNSKLFKRVETIYNQRTSLKLDAESNRLLEFYYDKFGLSGAKLSEADKVQMKKFNTEEASLVARYETQLKAANRAGAVAVDDKTQLNGLSEEKLKGLAENAGASKSAAKWLIFLQNTTQQPLLGTLTDRSFRQKLFTASITRGEKGDSTNTQKTIVALAQLRAEKARLLGYPNYATWKLQDQMAKTPSAVAKFLGGMAAATTAKARAEAAVLQEQIDNQKGGFKLEAWDWSLYSEQVRKQKYDLNDEDIKPYFELNNALENGVFFAATQLYGITFKERKDLPVYHKDVRIFEVFEEDGSQLGLFYCDYFQRANKQGGAWMSSLVGQSKLLGTKPVVFNVCNFTKPAEGSPALLSFADVTTLFHEFGHALHGLFSNQQYPSISGTSVARDFVEFPSQFNENWALSPKVVKNYAIHYKTKQPIPQALMDKIKNAATFNQGYALTEALAAASLDQQWHILPAGKSTADVPAFEKEALLKTNFYLPQVPPRYRSSYFQHIWSNGYAARYYAYAWTEVLAMDAFGWFKEHGDLTRANGQRFRDMILSRGNTIEYGKMFRDFRGRDPESGPMLKKRGLL
jgi:peptidyl-dipeptidase Dcp